MKLPEYLNYQLWSRRGLALISVGMITLAGCGGISPIGSGGAIDQANRRLPTADVRSAMMQKTSPALTPPTAIAAIAVTPAETAPPVNAHAEPELPATATTAPDSTPEPQTERLQVPDTEDLNTLADFFLQRWGDVCVNLPGKRLKILVEPFAQLRALGATGLEDPSDPLNVTIKVIPRSDFAEYYKNRNLTDAQIKRYYLHNFVHELFHYCRASLNTDVTPAYQAFYRQSYEYYMSHVVAPDPAVSPDAIMTAYLNNGTVAVIATDDRLTHRLDHNGETLIDAIIANELGEGEGDPDSMPESLTGYGNSYRKLLIESGITIKDVIPYMATGDYAGLQTFYISRVSTLLQKTGKDPNKAEPLVMGMMSIAAVIQPVPYQRHYDDYYDRIMSN